MFGKPPTKAQSMGDEELLRVLEREREAARDINQGVIGEERRVAYDYYYGKPFGNEEAGYSKVVSQVVSEVVDSALPEIIKVFASSDEAVQCSPRGPEDVDAAQQATDVCNYVFWTQNNGFLLMYEGVKDALLLKIGAWKYFWDDKRKVEEEKYAGLTMEQLTLLSQDPQVEIVGADQGEAGVDVVLRRTTGSAQIGIACIPPEELLVSDKADTVDPQRIPYVAHRTKKTLSDLVAMGYEVERVMDLRSDDTDLDDAQYTRDDRTGTVNAQDDEHSNPMMREVWYNEEYILIDYDGDGIAERRMCCSVGNVLLRNEVTERVPIAIITPKIMPHEFYGVSLADDSADLQLLKSTLWRQMMDNLYLSNRPRMGVVEGQVNLDDVLNPIPGGPVRMTVAGALQPIEVPFVAGQSFQMIEFLEQEIEGRTGISRYYQGLNPDSLNKTATGMNILDTRSQARVEMICRVFAETGIKQLFQGILYLLSKHQQQALTLRIRNQWQQVDPRAWATQYDFTVNVGLGSGNKQQQLQSLMVFGQILQASAQAGIVTPKNAYHYAAEAAKLIGRKDYDRFVTDPTAPEDPQNPRPPQQPPIELQVEQAKGQNAVQLEQVRGQVKGMELDKNAELSREQAANELQVQASNDQREVEMERYKADLEMQLEKYKIDKHAELELFKAQLKAQTDLDSARLTAQSQRGEALLRADIETKDKDAEAAEKQASADREASRDAEISEARKMLDGIGRLLGELSELQNAPREIVRGNDGRAVGIKIGGKVRKIPRGPDGRATGLQ